MWFVMALCTAWMKISCASETESPQTPCLSVNRSIRPEHLHMKPPPIPSIPFISYSVLFQECCSFLLSDKRDQGCRDGEWCRGNYVLLEWIILTIALGAIVLRTILFIYYIYIYYFLFLLDHWCTKKKGGGVQTCFMTEWMVTKYGLKFGCSMMTINGFWSNSETWLPWPVYTINLPSSGSQRILFSLNNAVISICNEITGLCVSLSISLWCSTWMLIKPLHLCHFHSSIQGRFGPVRATSLLIVSFAGSCSKFCVSSPNAVA